MMVESQYSGTHRGGHCYARAWKTLFCNNRYSRNSIQTVESCDFCAVLVEAIPYRGATAAEEF
jgi:hypothetical protein